MDFFFWFEMECDGFLVVDSACTIWSLHAQKGHIYPCASFQQASTWTIPNFRLGIFTVIPHGQLDCVISCFACGVRFSMLTTREVLSSDQVLAMSCETVLNQIC